MTRPAWMAGVLALATMTTASRAEEPTRSPSPTPQPLFDGAFYWVGTVTLGGGKDVPFSVVPEGRSLNDFTAGVTCSQSPIRRPKGMASVTVGCWYKSAEGTALFYSATLDCLPSYRDLHSASFMVSLITAAGGAPGAATGQASVKISIFCASKEGRAAARSAAASGE